ncbi:MAG: (Fe-S)-binding protein [Desulfobacterales bacterium]|nr:(Fe-S)-binding protein [Desulfobacterales bacterium]
MTEKKLCTPEPIGTKKALQTLLQDKGGATYYEEMKQRKVDVPALKALLKKTLKSRLKTWLSSCMKCGLCADSCFLYIANNKDWKQVPSYKIQSTLGRLVEKGGDVDTEFMIHCMDVAWSQCTCCNRCAMYCPLGIDVGVMFSYLRGILFSQGFIPWEMKVGSGMHRVYRAQMDVTTEDWVDTCEWMEEETEEEWPGLKIPIDKKDADIIYTVNAREPKHYPEDLAHAAVLFHLAGENWTVPSEGWEETSLAMFAGDWEAAKLQVESVYGAIDRLKPKRMVVTECGHAYRATVTEGPYWAGIRNGKPPVESLHYVEWLAEALQSGKLTIDPTKRIKEPVTYQDSCNYIRNAGLADAARYIMNEIATDFREMKPNREHNYCCGGGGGLNGIGRYREERNIGLTVKRDQILETGAKLVITPCHNCWDAIRDLEEVYHIGIKWSFLKPILLSMVVVPSHLEHMEW